MQKQTFVLIVNANKEFKRTEKKGKLRLVVDNTVDVGSKPSNIFSIFSKLYDSKKGKQA